MAANNSSIIMPIKDLKPGLNNLNLTFIVIEIGRPTTTKENQVSLSRPSILPLDLFSPTFYLWSCRR